MEHLQFWDRQTLSVLCCMVCRHRKKVALPGGAMWCHRWHHVVLRGATWHHLAPLWHHRGATVVPLLHMWCNHPCKGGTTVAPRWCHSGTRWCHVAPRSTTWCHRWHHIAPPGGATFFLCLQTIQQSTDRVVPPDTGMVCGADKGVQSVLILQM